MEKLPIIVLEYIAKFLSVKDLISCCSVCKSWRTVFNDNVFWKKHCNTSVTNYLSNTTSHFKLPYEVNSANPLVPISGWRLNFAREQTLWNNWRNGQFQLSEVKFDFDDSIAYNIKVECVSNDFVLIHTTFETQVWDLREDPGDEPMMTIPFCLNEMWEKNLYKFKDDKLVVVQCNVVQVYNVCLEDKTSTLDFVFFFDKPEEFSSNISKETDIDKLFQETSYSFAEDIECIICGDFFVGVVTDSTHLKHPKIHVWNWLKGKKIKEEMFSDPANPDDIITDVTLKGSETTNDEILVISDKKKRHLKSDFEIYNLTEQAFVKKVKLESGDCILYKNHLLHWRTFNIIAIDIQNPNVSQIPLYTDQENLTVWRGCEDFLMIAHGKTIEFFDTTDKGLTKFETVLNADFTLSSLQILGQKFVILYDMECCAREIWKVSIDPEPQRKVHLKKILSLPDHIGTFRSSNEVLTKIVFERANKLFVLNFW